MKTSYAICALLGLVSAKPKNQLDIQRLSDLQNERVCPDYEPNCQDPEPDRQPRGTPFAHYKADTYGGKKVYYNPQGTAGVYRGAGGDKKSLVQADRVCPDYEPNCQDPESDRQVRGTPFAHYEAKTYGSPYYNPLASAGVYRGGAKSLAQQEFDDEMQTEPCNHAIEPLCQQTENVNHQVIRGESKPFEHYHPATYGPKAKPAGYYNPQATAGVYDKSAGAATKKAAALSQTEPCDDSVEPLCQQTQTINHQVLRGDSTPWAHYEAKTYGPPVYYNPLASAGVYRGSKAALAQTEPCDDSVEPLCQQTEPVNYNILRGDNTPWAHYAPKTYDKASGAYYNPQAKAGVYRTPQTTKAAALVQMERKTEPCDNSVEPLCQQTEPTNHQVVRGDNTPWAHYGPKTYGPAPGYYNPLATSGVYRTAAPVTKSLVQVDAAPCEPALKITRHEMDLQFEQFSRTFDTKFYDNGMKILAELRKTNSLEALPAISSFSLYDTAFSWPRVRAYQFVQEELNKLQHFQDNANVNLSNSQSIKNFVSAAKEVRQALKAKYEDSFTDPAVVDVWEREEKLAEKAK